VVEGGGSYVLDFQYQSISIIWDIKQGK